LRGWEGGFRALKAPVEGPEPGMDDPLRGFKAVPSEKGMEQTIKTRK